MQLRFSFGLCLLWCWILPLSGCTHLQLQRNSIRQARTVADIYDQQVLDNLARFTVNPYSTPFFSVATVGTNTVDDKVGFAIADGGLSLRFFDHVGGDGSRDILQSWQLNPVTNPERLRLMQCAYQHAVGLEFSECDQCCQLEKGWYGKDHDCHSPCGITCGWVRCSKRWRDVPKCCCNKVGRHCGMYVWVDPCFENEFSKLVMKIVEYGAGDKPIQPDEPSKEVTFYLNSNDTIGTVENHSKVVVATVDGDASMEQIESDLKILGAIRLLEQELSHIQAPGEPNESNVDSIVARINRIESIVPEIKSQGVMEFSPNVAVDFNAVKERQSAIVRELKSQIHVLQQRQAILDINASARQGSIQRTPEPNFGPPAQNNGGIGGGMIQLQQRLDAVNPRRGR